MVAEHMARAPLGALNERRTGDIKTVLNEDIEKLELFLAHNLPDLVCYLVGPVVVFAYLMTVNIPLALVSLVPLVLAVVENHTITCIGTHEEVRKSNAYYRKAWEDYEKARNITYQLEGGEGNA